MSNISSLERENAREILKAYNQVDDTPFGKKGDLASQDLANATLPHIDEQHLKNEIKDLQEKYALLQNELQQREVLLDKLYRELNENKSFMARLKEDYEHAIQQLTT